MTTPVAPETDLVERARKRDPEALTEIVNRFSDRLFTLLVRILRNNEEAEDALQETFLTMLQKIPAFRGGSRLYTWLYRIAVNIALMKLRSKQRSIRVSIDENALAERIHSGAVAALPEQPEEILDKKELREILDRAIDQLPAHFRSVFILRDIEQLSVRETAKILGISEDNVKTRLRRARIFLRDKLAERFS